MNKLDPKTVIQLLREGEDELSRAGFSSARKEAEILLAYAVKKDFSALLTMMREPVPREAQALFADLLHKRKEHQPLQYLTGSQEFMSLEFEVNPAVLVPRWDTEILVELLLHKLQEYPDPHPFLVDLGTGSGAIIVSLAKYFPQGRYFAVDISPEALSLAEANGRRHGVDQKITFLEGDFLDPFLSEEGRKKYLSGEKLDFIVSNPPYIPTGEFLSLPGDVRQEPALALLGGEDGLDCYRKILARIKEVLKPGGYVFFEIGADQGAALRQLCLAAGLSDVKVFQDYGCRDRVVEAVLAG